MPHQNIKYMYMFAEGMCLMLGECVFKFNMLVRAGFYEGLCIVICIDEKYGPNHICKTKQLHMLLLTKEEMTGLEGVQDKPEANDEMGAAKGQVLQLSLCTMAGITTKKSWKLWGSIGSERVVVLLDCGASHNFISSSLISICGLQQEDTPPFVVEVGDGHKVRCQGKCQGFLLDL